MSNSGFVLYYIIRISCLRILFEMTQQQENVKADKTKAWLLASPTLHQPQNWSRRINRSVCCTVMRKNFNYLHHITICKNMQMYFYVCIKTQCYSFIYTRFDENRLLHFSVCQKYQMILLWLFILVNIRRGTRIYGWLEAVVSTHYQWGYSDIHQ